VHETRCEESFVSEFSLDSLIYVVSVLSSVTSAAPLEETEDGFACVGGTRFISEKLDDSIVH
jgi:hypothetical protein